MEKDDDNKEDEEQEDNDDKDDEEEEEEEEEITAGGDLEGCRPMSESLFETIGKDAPTEKESMQGPHVALPGTSSMPSSSSANTGAVPSLDVLRRSRVRWVVIRLSHRARSFLAQPPQNFMRLVSILRYFTALIESLPPALLLHLLEPLLSPVYRTISAFAPGATSSLPDVQTLEQVIQLNSTQQLEFLAQLAQSCMDSLTNKMQEAGKASELMQALAKVRKAVQRQRSDRLQKKRIQSIVDPEAAAQRKRSKNRRKVATRKRKIEEVIIAKKGGRGDKKARFRSS